MKRIHRSCVRRERYRFVSGGEPLTWERRIPGESHVEQVNCSADWFYRQMITTPGKLGPT